MELTDLSTVIEAADLVRGFLDLACSSVKGFGSSPACVCTAKDLLILHMDDLTVLQHWHGEFDGTLEGDLQLLESARQLLARTSNGVLLLPFSATVISNEHILKIGDCLRVFGHDTASGGVVAVSHQGVCHYITLQQDDSTPIKLPNLVTNGKRSKKGEDRRCVAACMLGRMIATAVREGDEDLVSIFRGDITVLDAEHNVDMQLSHTVPIPKNANVEVLLHPDLHRISTVWYETPSTSHWHCYSTFVGEVCFAREINLIGQAQAKPTKSRPRKELDKKVVVKPLGPTQILFASNDSQSLLTAWDVSYGAPLWTTPLNDASGLELLDVILPSAFSTSATLLFTNATAKKLMQCSLHASAGLAVSKKRSRLRDVLGVFRSSAAAAAAAVPETTAKLPKDGLMACLTEEEREVLTTSLSIGATTEKSKHKGEKHKRQRKRNVNRIPSGIAEKVVAVAVAHVDALSTDDWKLLNSLLQAGCTSSDTFRPLLRSARSAGQLDTMLLALRCLPDMGEREVIDTLRHVMTHLDDEQIQQWDYQIGQLVVAQQSADATNKKRRRKDGTEKGTEHTPMTRLRLLRIFVASAIQKNLSTPLLTDAFREVPIQEAIVILRLLMVFLRALSPQLAPTALLVADDEMSSLIRHELTLQRACRWAEAIVDSNFAALTLTATSDPELQTVINDLQALITEVQQETNQTEQTIGLCSYLSGTQNWDSKGQLRPTEEYQLEVMLI